MEGTETSTQPRKERLGRKNTKKRIYPFSQCHFQWFCPTPGKGWNIRNEEQSQKHEFRKKEGVKKEFSSNRSSVVTVSGHHWFVCKAWVRWELPVKTQRRKTPQKAVRGFQEWSSTLSLTHQQILTGGFVCVTHSTHLDISMNKMVKVPTFKMLTV